MGGWGRMEDRRMGKKGGWGGWGGQEIGMERACRGGEEDGIILGNGTKVRN